jgi:hypothetical protein
MKFKFCTFLILAIIVSGCGNYVQVFETKTTNAQTINDKYIFENDSLRIEYDFWAQNGLLSFTIYNKLTKPIYVDWKKSSYVNNGIKLNYWDDTNITKSVGQASTAGYSGIYTLKNRNFYSTVINSTSITSKTERITFIPPKSMFVKNTFKLLPIMSLPVPNYDQEQLADIRNKGKLVKTMVKNYDKNNSPLIFRNFFTFSTTESFEREFYVDNEFYISKVLKVKTSQFENLGYEGGKMVKGENGRPFRFSPYKKPRSFYLKIRSYNRVSK